MKIKKERKEKEMRSQIKEKIRERADLIGRDGKTAYILLMKYAIREQLRTKDSIEKQEWQLVRKLLVEHYVGFSKEAFLKDLESL